MKIKCIFSVVGIWGQDSYAFGINDDLIVRNSDDLKQFKELTTGNAIIMGRGTWESLDEKPLPNRKHIIVTSRDIPDRWVYSDDVFYAKTLSEAIDIANDLSFEEAWVVGGARLIIEAAKSYARELYITYFNTKVHKDSDMSTISQSDIESEQVRWKYGLSKKNSVFRSPSLVLGEEEALDVYFLHWTRRN
jgi:dihydrofolate reductase